MKYKVIPFVASIDPKKENSNHVAEQLQSVIDIYKEQGWEYVRLESVTTYVQPEMSCFGTHAKPGYNTNSQMVVFQK